MGVVTIKMKSKPFIFELIISSWLLISRASIFIEIISSFRLLISSFWLSIWRFRDSTGRCWSGMISGHPLYEGWNSKNWVLYRKLEIEQQIKKFHFSRYIKYKFKLYQRIWPSLNRFNCSGFWSFVHDIPKEYYQLHLLNQATRISTGSNIFLTYDNFCMSTRALGRVRTLAERSEGK